MSGYAAGGDFARSERVFAQTRQWLAGPEAAGLGLAGLEDQLADRGREILRQLLQDHLFAVAAAEPRLARVPGPDGIARTRSETGHGRVLSSVFGPVVASRIAYRAPGVPNVHPADELLGLPLGKHSPGLAKMTARGSAAGSLAGACAQVRERTGCKLGTRQAQELVRAAAADFGGFYASRPRPSPGPGQVLVLSCDAKGVKMRPGQLRARAERAARKAVPKQDGRLSQGEVGTRKRMAATGAVYVIDPVPRIPADITGPGPRRPGPRARRKWLTASVTATTAQVVAAIFAEADRRDPARQATWIALADGNKDQIAQIRAQAAARGITVTIVIDLIHVTEHLWDAAWCFFPKASPGAGPWVRARVTALLDGGPAAAAAIAAALRDDAAGLGKTRRTTAEKTAGYLEAKAPHLDYPAALAAGWPVATGVIEGACRHLVKDRMDITGARWGVATAEAILQLRALIINGDFDDYWTWHLDREHERTYPRTCALAA
jgi:hypothetical protein